MIPPAFLEHQRAARVAYLGSLHERCVRRFRDAALLVGAELAQWPAVQNWPEHRAELGALGPFWTRVCERYNAGVYDPRPDLLRPDDAPDDLFSRFVHWRLWPLLVSDNECTRNVLRATGSLPCRAPAAAGRALAAAMDAWLLHVEMRRPDPGYLT